MNILLRSALDQVERILGQLNRNPSSLAYGSFDRSYWHYRTNDISCARYQEAALTLALLYSNDFQGNKYFEDPKILEWIKASLVFTAKIQHKDGSFDEWYINEGSFVCTSFVVAALSEVLLTIPRNTLGSVWDSTLKVLEDGAEWLLDAEEDLVLNQSAGSLLALANVSQLSGNQRYLLGAKARALKVIGMQSNEGWWSEYGGPDIGYLSLMLDYLTKFYLRTGMPEMLPAITKGFRFASHFLHPNFTSGGEYCSRNTEYLVPSGFALFQAYDKAAETGLAFILEAHKRGRGICLSNLDDRYLCYIGYNWIQAGLACTSISFDIDHHLKSRRFDHFFKDCGIRVFQNDRYYFVVNLYKGGAFRVYSSDHLYLDSGVECEKNGTRLLSNVLDYSTQAESTANSCATKGRLKKVKEPIMSTGTALVFKSVLLGFFWFKPLQKILKSLLRKNMIMASGGTPFAYERRFLITETKLEVVDSVDGMSSTKAFIFGVKSSYNFIPSSKYFSDQEASKDLMQPKVALEKTESSMHLMRNFDFLQESPL